MAQNQTNFYDVDAHIAEAYDRQVTETDDVAFIRRLIGGQKSWKILEPFTGTGRILLPLALDGHNVIGIDQSRGMIVQARQKVAQLPEDARKRITLLEGDVVCDAWPDGVDLVILGGNCFYELATPQEQEQCVRLAAAALKPGGHVYIDNDHMEGELDPAWRVTGKPEKRGIQGGCADGSQIESWMETTWFDAPNRLVRLQRRVEVTAPDGKKVVREFTQQKHPVSAGEVRGWLEQSGFKIEQMLGDRQGTPYSEAADRAIFWAIR